MLLSMGTMLQVYCSILWTCTK